MILNATFVRHEEPNLHSNMTTCTDWTTTRWNTLALYLKSWQEIIDNKIILVHKRDKRSAASICTVKSIECSPLESSKHVRWIGNETTIQKEPNTSSVTPKKEENRISVLEKVKKVKRIKKLHTTNGHQRAIENITSVGNLLSSDYVDLVLDLYRINCVANIFIAGAYTTSLIRLEENTNNWRTFGRLFRNNNAIEKMDGVYYIIPTFTGSNDSGHWLVNVVWWEANQGRGFTLDSLGRGGVEKSLIQNKVKEFFGTNLFTAWDEIQCVRQTENECGPRMLQAIKTLSTKVDSLMEFESLVLDAANFFDLRRGESRNIAVRNKVGDYLRGQQSDT